MPTHIRCASVGWGTMEWRMSPPAPGPHSGRLGWFLRPSTCSHVEPPSVLRNRPAGSTPAYRPSSPAVTFQTLATFGPSSPYVSPSLEWVQVAPRSSLRKTAAPYHGLPAPANSVFVARSTLMSWIGHPSQVGVLTDQSRRSASDSRMKAPLGVPMRRRQRVIVDLRARGAELVQASLRARRESVQWGGACHR